MPNDIPEIRRLRLRVVGFMCALINKERDMDAENELRLKLYLALVGIAAVGFVAWLIFGHHIAVQ